MCRGCGLLCCVIVILIILFIVVLFNGSSCMTGFDYRNGDKKDAEDRQPWRNLVPTAGRVLPNPFILSGTTAERGGDEV